MSSPITAFVPFANNDFTRATYPERGTPMVRIPVSVPRSHDWQAAKDFERARSAFLWFGSGGLVHKGLDLVLEAFAGLPDCRLFVCGPISRERSIVRCRSSTWSASTVS